MEDRDGLRGLEQIGKYSGYSEKKLKHLARTEGFPMTMIAGKYESSKTLIDQWRRGKILASQKAEVHYAQAV